MIRRLLAVVAAVGLLTGATAAAAPVAAADVDHYVVQPGDSWSGIARDVCGCTLGELATANGTRWQTDALHPGRVLHLPPVTAPPTTTTTTIPETTVPSTTVAPSTTVPAEPGVWTATFDTAEDFYGRFLMHTGNYCTGAAVPNCRPENDPHNLSVFPGDHNEDCSNPYTLRDVDVSNKANLFWWCGGRPDAPLSSGHTMVGNATHGYAIAAFTPDRSFTDVTSVCWDVNLTDLGGGKWFNVILLPEATYLSNPNRNPTAALEQEGPYRLDYTSPGFNSPGDPGAFNLQGYSHFGLKLFRGTLSLWQDNSTDRFVAEWGGELIGHADKSARFRHCMTDNGDGTVTVTQARPGGTTRTLTAQASFPTGPVRVVFQDDTYDSEKHSGIDGQKTWHIDNVVIRHGG